MKTLVTSVRPLAPAACLFSTLAASDLAPAARAANYALQFNGVNQYGRLSRPVGDDFTIEFWFKSTQVTGSDVQFNQGAGLVSCETSGFPRDFGLGLGAGKVLFGTGTSVWISRSGVDSLPMASGIT